jgi:hypothetical protein
MLSGGQVVRLTQDHVSCHVEAARPFQLARRFRVINIRLNGRVDVVEIGDGREGSKIFDLSPSLFESAETKKAVRNLPAWW